MIAQNEKAVRNGVDVTALMETIRAISANPAIAEFKFRNENQWIDCGLNQSKIGDFYGAMSEHERPASFVFQNDEPPVLLGADKAPNPVEWLLHGMAGCITTTTVYHAAARGIRIDSMSTKLEGELDLRGLLDMPGAERPGYTGIKMSVSIQGDADEATLKELVEFGKQHSPAVDTISKGTNVQLAVNGR